jgi:hypothetical protein
MGITNIHSQGGGRTSYEGGGVVGPIKLAYKLAFKQLNIIFTEQPTLFRLE